MTDTSEISGQYLRVKAEKVSMLLDLVGELAIASADVIHNPELAGLSLDNFTGSAYRLETVIRSVQSLASELRLISLENLFRQMKRLARDLEKQTGKLLDLVISGENTEVDKLVVDKLHDPLLHLLRNAADHGIESPQERRLAGKPERGQIRLSATHTGSEIRVEVADDGRGLNREAILKKARQTGLVAPDAEPPDEEIWKLILHPGFSTAKEVTGLSGRGVGMDVVESSIRDLRGHMSINTAAGKGSSLVFHIPLTLAFLDALAIRVGATIYAVPIDAIRETVIPGQAAVISAVGKANVLSIRGELLPVCGLRRFFGAGADAPPSGRQPLLVIQSASGPFALPVEEILGQQQVTVKPITGMLKKIRAAAGWGLMGTGETALILDVEKLRMFENGKSTRG